MSPPPLPIPPLLLSLLTKGPLVGGRGGGGRGEAVPPAPGCWDWDWDWDAWLQVELGQGIGAVPSQG